MWIEKKGDKYVFRDRFRNPVTGEIKNVAISFPDKKRQTQEIARMALQEKMRKQLARVTVPENLTFQKLCDLYVEWQYEALKAQTASNTESKVNKLSELIGPAVPVEKLNAWYVKEQLKAEKACTYNDRLKVFKAMMRWAYSNDLVEDITYVLKLKRRKDIPVRIKDKDKYLEHEEIKALLAAENRRYCLLTKFLLLSGLRIGELIALKAKDVDTKSRTISIERSYSLRIGEVSSVKTESSCRIIYIQDELLEVVKEINSYRKEICKKTKKVVPYFFPSEDGWHISYDAYRKYLKEKSLKSIGRTITPHVLRHTHTALLAEAAIPIEQISRRLGHSNSKVTKEVYMHVNKSLLEKENTRLKGVVML